MKNEFEIRVYYIYCVLYTLFHFAFITYPMRYHYLHYTLTGPKTQSQEVASSRFPDSRRGGEVSAQVLSDSRAQSLHYTVLLP